jgi:uncharacterized membrane protein YjdF
VLELAHLLPVIMIILELCMNKIRIPWHHVLYTSIGTFIYFIITFIGQTFNRDLAPYLYALNWTCTKNYSFIVNGPSMNYTDKITKV